jgi:hypothetical protein
MAWSDWIPFVATIKHALADPKGRAVSDYVCHMDKSACDTAFQSATILKCEQDIDQQALKFLADFVSGGIVDQLAGGVVSLTLAAIVGLILKQLIAKAAAKAAIAAAGGVTIALALDGIADLAITLGKISQIHAAAEAAKKSCCTCP